MFRLHSWMMVSNIKLNLHSTGHFLVVGIGASAGGLEALQAFFSHMPMTKAMAFVVVQHFDPTHKAMLAELLQRVTKMRVIEITEHTKITPDCIFIIPPNKDLSMHNNIFVLTEPTVLHGFRLPIDFFFQSLAKSLNDRAVGVILSGMGEDGTNGLRKIKENAGLVLAQQVDDAKFDAMPRSAINSGVVDIVDTAAHLPKHIIDYLKYKTLAAHIDANDVHKFHSHYSLDQILILLRERTNNDFSLYKKSTIYRRIERRMGLKQIDGLAKYLSYLRDNPQELDLLFKELLIGVTSFFRDLDVWHLFKTSIFPSLIREKPRGYVFRVWVAACSTGEEAYSFAILFQEVLEQLNFQGQYCLQIFATDIDEDSIQYARAGHYPVNIKADVSSERLNRYFTVENNGFKVHKNIREMVIFATQNIIMDPPFTKLDVLSCRNLLIYLETELQKKLIPLFHYSLNQGGILLLGNAETIGGYNDLFNSLDKKSHIYLRSDNCASLNNFNFPQRIFPIISSVEIEPLKDDKMPQTVVNLKAIADQFLLQSYTPAAVLTNKEGDILYINGRTGKYLEPASGKANWNIFAMAKEGLRHEIDAVMKRAQIDSNPIHCNGIVIDSNGYSQMINLTVQALNSPDALRDTLIFVFNDVDKLTKTSRRKPGEDKKILINELEDVREQLQTMRQNMLNSQDALKAANEELQSTNEELQSTNEELTTSKEEMQSLNEELQTVNAELQSKLDDLSWVNNDMSNLLNSTEIATIFLDNSLKVRRFTTPINQLFKLIMSDIGRSLSDIVNQLNYDDLEKDSIEVLRTLIFIEKQVSAKDDRWYKVRIMPYRTQDNVIDGVVITFTDISDLKKMEVQLNQFKGSS